MAVAAELRRRADLLEADAKRKAEALRHQASQLESVTGELDSLTTPRNHATVATKMEAQTRRQRVSQARLDKANKRHPFVAALVDKGLTIKAVAADLGYPRSTVQSWYDSDRANRRPIPLKVAEAIRDRYGVPLDAWPNLGD